MIRKRSMSSSGIPVLKSTGDRDSRNRFTSGKKSIRSSSADKQVQRRDMLSIGRQNSNCYGRSSRCVTPLSSTKSPLTCSSSSKKPPIDDKLWRQESLKKIKRYFEEFTSYDTNCIKSGLSIDHFIQLVHFLLRNLFPNIILTKENYIEEIPRCLKLINFHSQVKPSLLKTVNTPHSWPHVVSILNALVDISIIGSDPIYYLYPRGIDEDIKNLHELALTKTVNAYIGYSLNGDDKFELNELRTNIECTIPFTDHEFDMTKTSSRQLHKEHKELVARLEKLKETIKIKKQTINDKQKSLDDYSKQRTEYVNTLQDAIINQTRKNDESKTKIEVNAKRIGELQAIVDKQPYTQEFKREKQETIKQLKQTLDLKQTRINKQKELIESYDFKLTACRQTVERLAYQYNNQIMELAITNPSINQLAIREVGFALKNFLEELSDVKIRLGDFEIELKASYQRELDDFKKSMSEIDATIVLKRDKLSKLKLLDEKKKQELIKSQEEFDQEIIKLTQIRDEQLKILTSLENKKLPSIQELQSEVNALKDKNKILREKKEEIIEKGNNFFLAVHEKLSNSCLNYLDGVMNTLDRVRVIREESEKKKKQLLDKALEEKRKIKKEFNEIVANAKSKTS